MAKKRSAAKRINASFRYENLPEAFSFIKLPTPPFGYWHWYASISTASRHLVFVYELSLRIWMLGRRYSKQGYRKHPKSSYGTFSRKRTWWAWQGLNLRPLRCQHSALPLSYTPTRVRRRLSLIDSQRAFWGPGPIATLRATCKRPSPHPS